MKSNKIQILLLFLLFAVSVNAQVSEHEYKAAFIERFTRFVEWPDNTKNDTFNIVVFGKTPLKSSMSELFSNIKIKGREVKLVYSIDTSQLVNADLVFISSSEKKNLKNILAYTGKHPILTIGDTKGYSDLGVHINMYEDHQYIRYEINQEAIKSSNLKVSSLLLTSAKIVKSDD